MTTWQYLVAFNNGPRDDPALITTVAPVGTVGGHNVWTDLSARIPGHSFKRGWQHELGKAEVGTVDIPEVRNDDGAFNPWNTSSPFYGLLKPGKPFQIRATEAGTTYVRYTGAIYSWPVSWPDERSTSAKATGSDGFRLFAAADITRTGYASTVLTAPLPVGYWRFGDPGGSTTLADSSGNNNPAQPGPNGVTLGQPGLLITDPTTSAGFDGSLGYVVLPQAAMPIAGQPFLLDFWFQTSTAPNAAGTNAPLFHFYDQNGHYLYAYLKDDSPSTGKGEMHIGSDVGSWGSGTFLPGNNFADGKPHFCVIGIDAAGNGTVYIFDPADPSPDYNPVYLSATFIWSAPAWVAPVTGFVGTRNGGGNFNGTMQDWAVWRQPVGSVNVFQQFYDGAGGWGEQTADARIGKVADTVGWSVGARHLSVCRTTVQRVTQPLTKTKALAYLGQVEDSEGGALFMDSANRLTLKSRDDLAVAAMGGPTIVFGDLTATELPYEPVVTVDNDDIDVWNEVTGQRVGGQLQIAHDQASDDLYGRRTKPLTNLLNTSDVEVLSRVNMILSRYAQPPLNGRLSQIVVNPLDDPRLPAAILGCELLTIAQVNRHTPPEGGTGFTETAAIEHIDEKVTPDSWTVTLSLAPAPVTTYWLWGVSAWDNTPQVQPKPTRWFY